MAARTDHVGEERFHPRRGPGILVPRRRPLAAHRTKRPPRKKAVALEVPAVVRRKAAYPPAVETQDEPEARQPKATIVTTSEGASGRPVRKIVLRSD
jgi:hypothetical protein